MSVEIDEPVRVAVVFGLREVHPVWFDWNGRQVRIREVAFTWQTREGSAVLLHFSVTDGQGLYEILFNRDTMEWRLRSAECEVRSAK